MTTCREIYTLRYKEDYMIKSRVWAVQIDCVDINDIDRILYFSSGEYIDESKTFYDIRLKQPSLISVNGYSGAVLQSNSESSIGEIELVNIDRELDYLADYAFDGRECRVFLVDEYGVKSNNVSSIINNIRWSQNTVSFVLRSGHSLFDTNHPNNTFLGNNILPLGLEGTSDIVGNIKPRIYGKVSHVSGVLVNTSKLAYQVCDSDDIEILQVYDKGVRLTYQETFKSYELFINSSINTGHYIVYKGYFRLGSKPVGIVTCDAKRSVVSADGVLRNIVKDFDSDNDVVMTVDDNIKNYEVGIYVNSETNTSTLISNISKSVGCMYDVVGNLVIFSRVNLDSTSYDIDLHDYNIISIERNATALGENSIPVNKVTVTYDKVYSVVSEPAGSVNDIDAARIANQTRSSISTNENIIIRNKLSKSYTLDSCLNKQSEATDLADWMLSILSRKRVDLYSVKVRLDVELINKIKIGNKVKLNSYKLNLANGMITSIIGHTIDAKNGRVELKLIGSVNV